jgi:hypothetical protein
MAFGDVVGNEDLVSVGALMCLVNDPDGGVRKLKEKLPNMCGVQKRESVSWRGSVGSGSDVLNSGEFIFVVNKMLGNDDDVGTGVPNDF